LQYLPNKVNEMNELNLDNQVSGTLMHRIRFCRCAMVPRIGSHNQTIPMLGVGVWGFTRIDG
jgi:hypothetical protein